jgi:hypothetical protein
MEADIRKLGLLEEKIISELIDCSETLENN